MQLIMNTHLSDVIIVIILSHHMLQIPRFKNPNHAVIVKAPFILRLITFFSFLPNFYSFATYISSHKNLEYIDFFIFKT